VVATCLAALDVLIEEPQIIEQLWENTRFFKAGLAELGFNTGMSESPITPVIVGDGALAMKLSDRLFQEGVFAQASPSPPWRATRRGCARSSRPRTRATSCSSRSNRFASVGRELGIR